MSVPSINLRNMASKLIKDDVISWFKFLNESENEIGYMVKQYDTPIDIKGSIQPLPKDKYEQLGLDLNKIYFDFYTSNNIIAVERDYSGDRAEWKGKKFKVADDTNWFEIDGWNHALLVLDDRDT